MNESADADAIDAPGRDDKEGSVKSTVSCEVFYRMSLAKGSEVQSAGLPSYRRTRSMQVASDLLVPIWQGEDVRNISSASR